MTPLSQQLAGLSAKAKRTEENFNRAQAEGREKFERDRLHARETAQQAVADLNTKVDGFRDEAGNRVQAIKAKLRADSEHLKEEISRDRREFSAWQKQNYAEACEQDAALAIEYAVAAIAMAESAVLDAFEARQEAEHAEIAVADPTAA